MGSLQHDCALIGANEVLKIVMPVTSCDYRQLHAEFYTVILATIESYAIMKARMDSRLSPLN